MPNRPVEIHFYFSTACFHKHHERCEKKCKHCFAVCICNCHNGPDTDSKIHKLNPDEVETDRLK